MSERRSRAATAIGQASHVTLRPRSAVVSAEFKLPQARIDAGRRVARGQCIASGATYSSTAPTTAAEIILRAGLQHGNPPEVILITRH